MIFEPSDYQSYALLHHLSILKCDQLNFFEVYHSFFFSWPGITWMCPKSVESVSLIHLVKRPQKTLGREILLLQKKKKLGRWLNNHSITFKSDHLDFLLPVERGSKSLNILNSAKGGMRWLSQVHGEPRCTKCSTELLLKPLKALQKHFPWMTFFVLL